MFGDRHRTVSLCAPARYVCLCVRERERKSCGEQPDAAIAADKDRCLCVDSRIQLHQLRMLDLLLFALVLLNLKQNNQLLLHLCGLKLRHCTVF